MKLSKEAIHWFKQLAVIGDEYQLSSINQTPGKKTLYPLPLKMMATEVLAAIEQDRNQREYLTVPVHTNVEGFTGELPSATLSKQIMQETALDHPRAGRLANLLQSRIDLLQQEIEIRDAAIRDIAEQSKRIEAKFDMLAQKIGE